MKPVWIALAVLLAAGPALAQDPPTAVDRQALLDRLAVAAREEPESLVKRNSARRSRTLDRVLAANPGQAAKVIPIVDAMQLCVATAITAQTSLDAVEVASGMTDEELQALVDYQEEYAAQRTGPPMTPADKDVLAVLASEAPLKKLDDGLSAIRARGVNPAMRNQMDACYATMGAALDRDGLKRP